MVSRADEALPFEPKFYCDALGCSCKISRNMYAQPSQSLLIIDDHPIYREALVERLTQEFKPQGIEVLGASSAAEGLEILDHGHKQWIILLDILMPGLSGVASIKVFKTKHNVTHVIAVSGLDENAWEPRSVAAGATLFLSKNNTSDRIIGKIKSLLDASPSVKVLPKDVETQEFRLTQRQLEVLQLIAMGHPNKVIADYLDIKEQTIKIHINQIFKELRVFNRTQAVLKAQKSHLLTPSSPPVSESI
jgi:DNA-binding NarL/FixJ family response regulator